MIEPPRGSNSGCDPSGVGTAWGCRLSKGCDPFGVKNRVFERILAFDSEGVAACSICPITKAFDPNGVAAGVRWGSPPERLSWFSWLQAVTNWNR